MPSVLYFQDEDEEWVILQHPPLYDPEASKQQELQKVEVDFKPPDQEDDPQGYVIRRDQIGSLELIDSLNLKEDDEKVKGSLCSKPILQIMNLVLCHTFCSPCLLS